MQRQEQRQGVFGVIAGTVRYEARLAARRYDAVDPDQNQRIGCCGKLEARLNAALPEGVGNLEDKLHGGRSRGIKSPGYLAEK